MADNNEIFDLLSKMYSELTNKIDGLNSEMKEMKDSIKNVDTKIDKGFNDVNIRIDNLSADIGEMVISSRS